MNGKDLSRLAVLSEALVYNPTVYSELLRHMSEVGTLEKGTELETVVHYFKEMLEPISFSQNLDEARDQLRELVPEMLKSEFRSPQWHGGQMLFATFEYYDQQN